jgi:hypothetical protein
MKVFHLWISKVVMTPPIILFLSRNTIGRNYYFFRIFTFLLITKAYETNINVSVLSTTFFLFKPICATAKSV